MKMSRKEFGHFQRCFRDWEATLTRILPRAIAIGDPDISEDIPHLLSSRSGFEEDFERYGDDPKLFPYLLKMVTLDAELLLRRNDILRSWSLRSYRSWRKRNNMPRTHWWWYLDEVREDVEVTPTRPNVHTSTH
jgi:hypothetical protein